MKTLLPTRLIPPLLLLLSLVLLTACATPAPAPDPDAPILTSLQSQPKALATVAPSATPIVQVTPTDDGSRPTSTPPRATITGTPTPMVGNFIGVQTRTNVEGTFSWNPTRGPKVIIVTIRPGSRTPPPALAGAPVVPGVPVAVNGTPNSAPIVIGGGQPIPAATPGGVVRSCPGTPVAPQFAGAFARYSGIGEKIGCPVKAAFGLKFVSQPFQNGVMFWRETKEMFALTNTNQYFRATDNWNDSLPTNDPSLVPPSGLQQPVRGFGYVWRSNPTLKNALGWALSGEQSYDGFWQDFERGFMISGASGTVYALIPLTGDGGQHLGALQP